MSRPPLLRLDSRVGWKAVLLDRVSARGDRLALAPLPGTARPIAAPAGAFAGLATPISVTACEDGALFILDGAHRVLRYDPCRERFDPVPCQQAGAPGLRAPVAIACHRSGELELVDGETRRVTAIARDSLRVRRHWGPFVWKDGALAPGRIGVALDPVTGVPTGGVELDADVWDPQDVAILPDGRIAISDRAAGRIHIFDRRGRPCLTFDGAGAGEAPLYRPGAMAVDRDGWLYVVEEGRAAVAVIDAEQRIVERTEDSEALRGRFAAPAIAVDDDGTIWISDRSAGVTEIIRCDCAGRRLPPEPAPLTPPGCAFLAFDADGRPILGDPRSPCLVRADDTRYAGAGRVLCGPLDSGQARTVWDRIGIDGEAPLGTRLLAGTFATDIALDTAEIDALPANEWAVTAVDFAGRPGWSGAVLSGPGRWLWLRLEFASDGAATPIVRALTLRSPRATSMRYLPGCFAADPASADFLARFTGLFDEARSRTLAPVDRLPAYFDPRAAPAAEQGSPGADFLDWLAGWIGIALDRNWSVARRRRLVAEAPYLFRQRGTVAGLKRHIAVYTGVEPRVVEHFRLRRWLSLDEGRLGDDAALWGPEIVRRLQLDAYSEIGRFALVDGGDPLTDPFDAFAHRATLYVPVPDDYADVDRDALERVAEAAKPAHVDVDIRLMRPRFVVGCDLVLGVNTVLGRHTRPARADESVLGEDIRLAEAPGFSPTPGLRLGVDSILE
jgi:phage tail-like protein